jgi:hypothetical protein
VSARPAAVDGQMFAPEMFRTSDFPERWGPPPRDPAVRATWIAEHASREHIAKRWQNDPLLRLLSGREAQALIHHRAALSVPPPRARTGSTISGRGAVARLIAKASVR